MPDNKSLRTDSVELYWLTGKTSEIEPLPSPDALVRRIRLGFPSEACAIASQIARSHEGLVVVEASCPGFVAVCQILGRAPNVRFITLHQNMRCMESISIPPPALDVISQQHPRI